MVNVQEWLDKNYPINGICQREEDKENYNKNRRENVKELNISRQELEGDLNLKGFVNLEKFDCSFNKLSSIGFLEQLPNKKKLKILHLSANNINNDLTPFSNFISLEDLDLGIYGYTEEFIKQTRNNFYGSLKPLRNLTKLKILDISNTDIDIGLEYLPKSVKEICCKAEKQLKISCRYIQKRSGPYKKGNYYDYQAWREDNKELVENVKKTSEELKEEIQKLQVKEGKSIQQLNKKQEEISQPLSFLKFNLKEELAIIQKELLEVREEIRKINNAYSSVLYEQLQGSLKLQISLEQNVGIDLSEKVKKITQEIEEKNKELIELQTKNIKLAEQCFFYLDTISQFREKQQELNELRKSCLGTKLTEDKWNTINDLKEKLTNLDNQLETILQTQLTITQNKQIELIKKSEHYLSKPEAFALYGQVVAELEVNKLITKEEAVEQVEEQLTDTLKKSLEFIGIRKLFLVIRQETINNLWKCYNDFKWSINVGKHAITGEVGNAISNVVGSLSLPANAVTFGIPKAVGEGIKGSNNLLKIRSSLECIKEFQKLLKEDNKKYFKLMKFLNKSSIVEEVKLFDTKYKIYDVATNIRGENTYLELDEMKTIIEKLTDNLKVLKTELDQQKERSLNQQSHIEIPPK